MAVATALCSKVFAAALQLVAFPVAVRSLGAERFGVYALLASSLSWVYLVGLGLGPGLTLKIASAVASQDQAAEKVNFSSAFYTVCALMALIVPIPIILLSWYPGYMLFGAKYAPYATEIQYSLYVLLGFVTCHLILSVVDAAQTGYQEQHVNNLWTMVGAGISIVAMIVASVYFPTIIGLIVSVNIGILFGRLFNMVNLLVVKRPYLLPRLWDYNFQTGKMFLLDGLAFSMLNLGHYFCHQFSQVIVGRKLGPTALASYAIMIQWYILLNGLISMVGRPLWPALTDAIARRDYAWARSVYRKLLRYSCAYGLVVGVAFLTLGRPLAHMLYHGHIHLRTSLLLFMGLYFVLIMWEYVQTTMLIGLNRIWVPSVSIVSRGILILIIGPPLMRYMGEAGMALALCLSILITSAWFCPLMVRKYLRLSERYQTAPL